MATAATWTSVLLIVLVGALASSALARQLERHQELIGDETRTLVDIREVNRALAESVDDAQESLRTGEPSYADAYRTRHAAIVALVQTLGRDAHTRGVPLEVAPVLSSLLAHAQAWAALHATRPWEDPARARDAVAELRATRWEVWTTLWYLEDDQLARLRHSVELARRESVWVTSAVLAFTALATLAAGALGLATRRALQRLTDARERVAREAASAEQRERERAWLQRVIDQLPMGIVILDAPDGVVRLANEMAATLDPRLRPGTPLRTMPPERRPVRAATGQPFPAGEWPVDRAIEHGERVQDEILVVAEDGTRRVCMQTAGPIRDDTGAVVSAAMALHDVTEAHRLAAGHAFLVDVGLLLSSLREPLDAVQRLADTAVPRLADGLAIHLVEGDEVALAGLAVAEPALEPLARSLPGRRPVPKPGQRGIAQAWFAPRPLLLTRVTDADLVHGARSPAQLELLRAARLCSVLQVPVRSGDRTYGVITAATSVSNRPLDALDSVLFETIAHRLALGLENAQLFSQARDAAREREEVLAIVAHDLRGPLTSLTVRVGLLARRRPDDAEVQATAALVVRAAHQMEFLVRVLLDAARIEAGSFRVVPERTDLGAVIEAACSLASTRAREADVRLEVAPHGGLPPVRADAQRAQQALSNLLGNALDHTPAGRTIEVITAVTPTTVQVAVRDEGVGIPAEQVPHVFERHWQGEHRRSGGLGLGLFIVRGIVEAHGGRVWVSSQPGAGATFWFELPRADGVDTHHPA